MTEAEKAIKQLIDTIASEVNEFNDAIPGVQKDIFDGVQNLMKQLDVVGDTITANVANMKAIAGFKDKMMGIIRKSDYPDAIKGFVDSFSAINDIQHEYFSALSNDFTAPKLMAEVQKQSVASALDSLTEVGLNAKLIKPVNDYLLKNIGQGIKYTDAVNYLRDFITGSPEKDGALLSHAKTTTTDSLNQYARQYSRLGAFGLGLEWGMYVGAIIDTSRPFCIACVAKKYIHQSEIDSLLAGDFPEFEDADGEINPRTGLPSGLIDGTTPENFSVYCGGWGCEHVWQPISEIVVPKSVRIETYSRLGIPYDDEGFRAAA